MIGRSIATRCLVLLLIQIAACDDACGVTIVEPSPFSVRARDANGEITVRFAYDCSSPAQERMRLPSALSLEGRTSYHGAMRAHVPLAWSCELGIATPTRNSNSLKSHVVQSQAARRCTDPVCGRGPRRCTSARVLERVHEFAGGMQNQKWGRVKLAQNFYIYIGPWS